MASRSFDQYVESLAAEIHRVTESWFRSVDPYHALSPRWFALRDDLKQPYRDFALAMIRRDRGD